MSWRVRILTLLIIAVFMAGTWIYLRFYVVPPPHGVILFVAPGLSSSEITEALGHGAQDGEHLFPKVVDLALIPKGARSTLDALSSLSTGRAEPRGSFGLQADSSPADHLAYRAQRAGRSIGLVTGNHFTHPACAAFYSHTRHPEQRANVIPQLFDSTKWNALLGGARAELDPAAPHFGGREPAHPSDSRNLIEEARLTGYRIVNRPDEFDVIPRWRTRYLLGAFRFPDAFYDPEAHSHSPAYQSMVTLAIECLQFTVGGYFMVAVTTDLSTGPEAENPEFRQANLRVLANSIQAACDYSNESAIILLYIPGLDLESGQAILFRGRDPLPPIGTPAGIHRYLRQYL